MPPLRLAAIDFLNPAPLLYDFEHEPARSDLTRQFAVRYTAPSECARQLLADEADLGLIPVAALTPELAVVPGCAIASQREVRSILLLVKNVGGLPEDEALRRVRTVAADRASRSSQAYLRVLLAEYLDNPHAQLADCPADPLAMLRVADAALLIGDPALIARERRTEIDAATAEPLLWIDIAALWHRFTALPWVAAVWAVRPQALAAGAMATDDLVRILNRSREHGCAATEQLVREWTPRLAVPPATIRRYLTRNIYYELDTPCQQAIQLFRRLAAEHEVLPPLGHLALLQPAAPCVA